MSHAPVCFYSYFCSLYWYSMFTYRSTYVNAGQWRPMQAKKDQQKAYEVGLAQVTRGYFEATCIRTCQNPYPQLWVWVFQGFCDRFLIGYGDTKLATMVKYFFKNNYAIDLYFLFKMSPKSLNHINIWPRYSKIIRICKKCQSKKCTSQILS